MTVLWELRNATVAEVVAAPGPKRRGQLQHRPDDAADSRDQGLRHAREVGRAFIYRPLIDQKQARRKALQHLVSRLFNNSPSLLVLNVLEDKRIDAERARAREEAARDALGATVDAIANWIWQGSAIALAVTLVLRRCPRRSAPRRGIGSGGSRWRQCCCCRVLPGALGTPRRRCQVAPRRRTSSRCRRCRGGRRRPLTALWIGLGHLARSCARSRGAGRACGAPSGVACVSGASAKPD